MPWRKRSFALGLNQRQIMKIDDFLKVDLPLIPMPHIEFQPLSSNGHRLICAKDGLYKEIRRSWLHAIYKVAECETPFGEIQPALLMPFGIKTALLHQFQKQAEHAGQIEIGAWIIWNQKTNEQRLISLDAIEASAVKLTFKRPVLAQHDHLIVDMHSHHNMEPTFSVTDDKDDLASNDVKIAAVIGNLHKEPTWNFRMCLEGHALPDFQKIIQRGCLP